MANIRREMIDLKNKHAAETQQWIYAVFITGFVMFGLGGIFDMIVFCR